MPRFKGKVKWYDAKKGYGFIECGRFPKTDIFVHHSSIISSGFRSLKDGEEVEFDMMSSGDKKKAVNCLSASRKAALVDGRQITEGKLEGTVKWYNCSKGFGFITCADKPYEFFVHQSSINASGFRSLRIGETVEFVPEEEMDRWKAVQVCAPGGGEVEGAPHPSARRSSDDHQAYEYDE